MKPIIIIQNSFKCTVQIILNNMIFHSVSWKYLLNGTKSNNSPKGEFVYVWDSRCYHDTNVMLPSIVVLVILHVTVIFNK